MGENTKIEWCDRTWNPVTGCTPISRGCVNCYAARMAKRLQRIGGKTGKKYKDGFAVACHRKELAKLSRRQKPRRIFVCSMSDLFHEAVPQTFILNVFGRMHTVKQHTYVVLTKRPERMVSFLVGYYSRFLGEDFSGLVGEYGHVWLGTSIEDQSAAEERVLQLNALPSPNRFLSCEPLLGRIDLVGVWRRIQCVIIGGESGPGARPCQIEWIESLVEQCDEVGVKAFVKQLGANAWWKGKRLKLVDKKGGDWTKWPAGLEHLKRRELPWHSD